MARKLFQAHLFQMEQEGYQYEKTLSDFSDRGDLIIFKDGSAALVVGLQHKSVLCTFSPYMVKAYIKTDARRTWA